MDRVEDSMSKSNVKSKTNTKLRSNKKSKSTSKDQVEVNNISRKVRFYIIFFVLFEIL